MGGGVGGGGKSRRLRGLPSRRTRARSPQPPQGRGEACVKRSAPPLAGRHRCLQAAVKPKGMCGFPIVTGSGKAHQPPLRTPAGGAGAPTAAGTAARRHTHSQGYPIASACVARPHRHTLRSPLSRTTLLRRLLRGECRTAARGGVRWRSAGSGPAVAGREFSVPAPPPFLVSGGRQESPAWR